MVGYCENAVRVGGAGVGVPVHSTQNKRSAGGVPVANSTGLKARAGGCRDAGGHGCGEQVTHTSRSPPTPLFANLRYIFTVCYSVLILLYKKKGGNL